MFEDGSLVPGNFEHPLQSWRFESSALNALFIAVLTTILSYQAAAAASDLILGLKPRNVSRASDFHAVLLTDEGSLKSICAALLRKDWLDRARFPRKIPHDTTIAREPFAVKRRVTVKLLILLSAAPLLNVLAVIITLERDQEITFSEAEFGGIALGVNQDLSSLVDEGFSESCFTIPFKVEDHQRARASFFWCLEATEKDSDGSWISVATTTDEAILVKLVISGIQYEKKIYADMQVDQDTFRIMKRTSEATIRELIEYGNKRLSKFCLRNNSTASGVVLSRDDEAEMTLSKNVSCTKLGSYAANIVLLNMAERVTLVETGSFEVLKHSDPPGDQNEFMKADDLILLEQRTSYVGLGTLFVAVGCMVFLRIIVKLLTRNDVHHGITVILKACFAAKSRDSLLRWKGRVRYDHMHQEGETAHFGVKSDKLQEVKDFAGGEVGIVDERPCVLVEKCITVEDAKRNTMEEVMETMEE